MKVITCKDYETMSQKAADDVAQDLREKPGLVLGLATGSSPLGIYRCLADLVRQESISCSRATGFQLDEYCGLTPDHPQSFHHYLKEHLLNVTDFREEHLHGLNGTATDWKSACISYEEQISAAGGIDLLILGLGQTGHIGFNEPDNVFPVHTHRVKLEKETIRSNARFFDSPEQVPRAALTMGIGTIMGARKIILLVNGRGKAGILKDVLTGSVKPQIPASILRFHQNVTVYADEEAMSAVTEEK